jgi:hypothetical protein
MFMSPARNHFAAEFENSETQPLYLDPVLHLTLRSG